MILEMVSSSKQKLGKAHRKEARLEINQTRLFSTG